MDLRLIVYPSLLEKLNSTRNVELAEVEESFFNRQGPFAKELRVRHLGSEDRFWFISETDQGRELKVVFILDDHHGIATLITAYEPNEIEVKLYERLQKIQEDSGA